jgi:hypothetical protein
MSTTSTANTTTPSTPATTAPPDPTVPHLSGDTTTAARAFIRTAAYLAIDRATPDSRVTVRAALARAIKDVRADGDRLRVTWRRVPGEIEKMAFGLAWVTMGHRAGDVHHGVLVRPGSPARRPHPETL